LVGKAPKTVVNHIALPGVATLSLATKTVNAFRDKIPVPAKRSVVLSGKVPTFEHTEHHVARPPSFAMNFTPQGVLPQEAEHEVVGPPVLVTDLDTYAPTLALTTSELDIPAAAVAALAGQTPAAVVSQLRPIAAATLSLTGKTTNRVINTVVATPVAPQLTFTTYDIAYFLTQLNLVLEGKQPVIVMNHIARPAAASLALSSVSFDFEHNSIIMFEGALTLQTYAPDTIFSSFLEADDTRLISLSVDYDIVQIAIPVRVT
jgi:hypothetical protein